MLEFQRTEIIEITTIPLECCMRLLWEWSYPQIWHIELHSSLKLFFSISFRYSLGPFTLTVHFTLATNCRFYTSDSQYLAFPIVYQSQFQLFFSIFEKLRRTNFSRQKCTYNFQCKPSFSTVGNATTPIQHFLLNPFSMEMYNIIYSAQVSFSLYLGHMFLGLFRNRSTPLKLVSEGSLPQTKVHSWDTNNKSLSVVIQNVFTLMSMNQLCVQ